METIQTLKYRDKVYRALSNSSLNTLTPTDVLLALKEEGIENLEDLVTRLLKMETESSQDSRPPSRFDVQHLAAETPKELAASIVHQVPNVPFTLNGTAYDPKDISRFDGRPLDFAVTWSSSNDFSLVAFEDRNILTTYAQVMSLSRLVGVGPWASSAHYVGAVGVYGKEGPYEGPGKGGGGHPAGIPPGTELPPSNWAVFEHAGRAGDQLTLPRSVMHMNLTQVSRNCFLGICSDWNDIISSIGWSSCTGLFCEHVDFQGDRIVLDGHPMPPDLWQLGWNDRISSLGTW